MFAPLSWHDPKDAAIYRKILAHESTYDFLASLDRTLDDICGHILDIKPLPSLDEIFTEVHSEDSRKHVILSPSSPTDSSALADQQFDGQNKSKKKQWCYHCQRPYHTKTMCWKLHGKSVDWVPRHLRGPNSKGIPIASNCAIASNLDIPFFTT